MEIKVLMSKETAEELGDKDYFEKLSKEEQQVWFRGYEYAIKSIKKASWFQRLFNLFC